MQADVPTNTASLSPSDPVPAGFTPYELRSPYFNSIGPIFVRPAQDGGMILGLRVAGKHLNLGGVTHGGMLLTLADGAMSASLAAARVPRQRNVTVSLSSEFLDGARPGDWLEAHVSLRKVGGRLAFVDCDLMVGERCVLHASAVFSVSSRPNQQGDSDG